MKQEIFVYFIGTAGAGKSTLAERFHEWTNVKGIDSILVNLDPGAENLPYDPDVDIRDWISLKEVMESHELGPNGAQIACADLLAVNTDEIKESIESFKTDYVFVDTPGQLELFVFRNSGRIIATTLRPQQSVVCYLIDPILAKSASGFTSQLLLSVFTSFRLGLPQFSVLSKSDVLEKEDLEQVLSWAEDAYSLESAVQSEHSSMYRQINEDIVRMLIDFQSHSKLISTGSKEFSGIEDMYTMIQMLFAGGEDVLSD
jgi:GPN-loop GTPase